MSDIVDSTILKRYQIIKKVGQGAYGQVWKVKNKRTGEILALKKIYDAFRNNIDAQRTYREIMYMKLFDHPNIIKMLSCHRPNTDRDIYITMQFMEADLSSALKNSLLKDIHKQFIFYQVTNALYYLHSGDIIHRDLKPANILVNSKCQVKICDFGLIRSVNQFQNNQPMTENVATRWYRAPEVLLGSQSYNKQADVWSLGCILAQIYMGKPILQGTSTLNQVQKIIQMTGKPTLEQFYLTVKDQEVMSIYSQLPKNKKKSFSDFFPKVDPLALDLLQKMLTFNPLKRPTMAQILEHDFIRKFKGKVEQKISNLPFKIQSDTKRKTVQQYRMLIYSQIDTQSRESQLSTISSFKQKKIHLTNNYISKLPQKYKPAKNKSISNFSMNYEPKKGQQFDWKNIVKTEKYKADAKSEEKHLRKPSQTKNFEFLNHPKKSKQESINELKERIKERQHLRTVSNHLCSIEAKYKSKYDNLFRKINSTEKKELQYKDKSFEKNNQKLLNYKKIVNNASNLEKEKKQFSGNYSQNNNSLKMLSYHQIQSPKNHGNPENLNELSNKNYYSQKNSLIKSPLKAPYINTKNQPLKFSQNHQKFKSALNHTDVKLKNMSNHTRIPSKQFKASLQQYKLSYEAKTQSKNIVSQPTSNFGKTQYSPLKKYQSINWNMKKKI